MNEALKLLRVKLVNLINNLKEFALKYKDMPALDLHTSKLLNLQQ